ncbi:MAG: hypothetical protein V2J08_06075 [Desulfotignum sp.]|jgi:hypothetical protein|nr:hypothetical protein [Desulfotignum sp.]
MYTSVGVVVLACHIQKKTGASHAALSDAELSKIHVCIDTVFETGMDDIAVVVNEEQWEIGAALSGYPVCIAVNNGGPDVQDMVYTGIKALPGYTTGVIVIAMDNPPALAKKYADLVRFHHQVPRGAVLPGNKRQNRYAALFPVASYPALSKGLMKERLIPGERSQLHAAQ